MVNNYLEPPVDGDGQACRLISMKASS
jgi:hypothetical protein